MFDQSFFLDGSANTKVYKSPSLTDGWVTWEKPLGCKMIHIICIGAGSGGGGGRTGASGTDRGGGGGGTGGGVTASTYASILLPDLLYVQVGAGGVGGTAGNNGGSGGMSIVSVYPDTNAVNRVCASSNVVAVSGKGSTSSAGGAGGTAVAVATAATATFLSSGNFLSIANRAGGAGGSSATAGVDVNSLAGTVTSPGAGGGGTDVANTTRSGGFVYATPDILENQDGGSGAGGNGRPGFDLCKPFLTLGGTGGASNGTGTGGSGGGGGTGSGGGGGGAGVTGGVGGNGGDGMIVISCW
tara:strand:+ start:2459 stop:3355 length:897 start_codon:yes stop_codon:yes gene_type:complete